jgi:hypothetical protein
MIYLKFLWSLLRHKYFVFRAGMLTGIPLWRLFIHDWTKFLPVEFFRYARNFHGKGTNPAPHTHPLDFSYAWLHHENVNPHHWGHWIARTGPHANKPLPMPETYVRELVADCMGAGRAYTGVWDIAPWLNKNGAAWILHDETLSMLHSVLFELDYILTDNCPWSWVGVFSAKKP